MKMLMQYWDREKGQAVTVSNDNPLPSDQSNATMIDTSDANATAEDIRKGKVVYVDGQRIVGTAEF